MNTIPAPKMSRNPCLLHSLLIQRETRRYQKEGGKLWLSVSQEKVLRKSKYLSQFLTPGNFLEKCLQFSWQGV